MPASADAATTTAAATAAPAAKPGAALKVGLVTDVGKVDDKSFNQSAWEGVQRARTELGATVKFLETTDPKDYSKHIEQFATDNYDIIVTVSFALGQGTQDAAKKYPKIKFIGVNQFQDKDSENLAGLIFDEDKAGYRAGVLAASITKGGTIGPMTAPQGQAASETSRTSSTTTHLRVPLHHRGSQPDVAGEGRRRPDRGRRTGEFCYPFRAEGRAVRWRRPLTVRSARTGVVDGPIQEAIREPATS